MSDDKQEYKVAVSTKLDRNGLVFERMITVRGDTPLEVEALYGELRDRIVSWDEWPEEEKGQNPAPAKVKAKASLTPPTNPKKGDTFTSPCKQCDFETREFTYFVKEDRCWWSGRHDGEWHRWEK